MEVTETSVLLYIREAAHRNLQGLLQHAQVMHKPRLCKIDHREGNWAWKPTPNGVDNDKY